jgi:hemerythrin-like metal-binding protein
MALITWNEYFVTGIEQIDEQHRWLVDLVNSAAPVLALNYQRSHVRADSLLDQLEDYVQFHFDCEDRLMRDFAIDSRHLAHHRQSHAGFAAEVRRMRAAYTCGATPSGGKLLAFLANWLIYHLLGEDQALIRQIRAIEAGESPPAAFASAAGDRCEPTPAALTQALVDQYTQMSEQNRKLIESNHALAETRTNLEELVSERTNELVRALDAAESACRARSSFLANMSHEIRTPMNAIVGLTWSLRKHTGDPVQQARLAQVGDAADKLLTIINDLLDMARIESDLLHLEPLDFDPGRVVREVADTGGDRAAAKGLAFECLVADLPALVRGDPVRLGQILANFTNNAIKFTDQGRIDLRAFRLPPAGKPARPRLRFEVADSGSGIATAHLERLFEPFEQLDSSPSRRYGGTGLGLAISRRLAEMMGGSVGVDSTPGQGSTFWLEVPVEEVAQPISAPPAWAPTGDTLARNNETLRRLAALLAEDDVQAIPLWHESAASLRPLLHGLAEAFEAALAAYDFAAAYASVAALIGGGEVDATAAATASLAPAAPPPEAAAAKPVTAEPALRPATPPGSAASPG